MQSGWSAPCLPTFAVHPYGVIRLTPQAQTFGFLTVFLTLYWQCTQGGFARCFAGDELMTLWRYGALPLRPHQKTQLLVGSCWASNACLHLWIVCFLSACVRSQAGSISKRFQPEEACCAHAQHASPLCKRRKHAPEIRGGRPTILQSSFAALSSLHTRMERRSSSFAAAAYQSVASDRSSHTCVALQKIEPT